MAYRRARELYGQRRYREALVEARNEHISSKRLTSSFVDLLDEICMHSAATGEVIGFDGRVFQVVPSNPDTAWLGLHAELPQQASPHTFNSIADALDAAADGDVIQLLPGIHLVSQVSLNVNRRVLIEGVAASAQQVVLDHRANHPAFVITRSCILNNFTIDMVGFCEAVAITGSSITVKPILRGLRVSCSGDDGFSSGGKAQALMQSCHVEVHKCGIKQYDDSSLTLWQCSFSNCQHAIMTAGTAQCFLEGCHILDCNEDGIIGLEQSTVHLTGCFVTGCKGPGIDMSDRSAAKVKGSEVKGCCGGIWLWDCATCEAISSHIDGGSSYAVLLDADAYACGSSCTIDGPCHDSSEAPTPANIRRSTEHSRQMRHEEPDGQICRAAVGQHNEVQSSFGEAGAAAAVPLKPGQLTPPHTTSAQRHSSVTTVHSSRPMHDEEPSAKHAKREDDLIDHLQKQMCQQEPCSPFSSGSCSGSSLHSSDDFLGYYGSRSGSIMHSDDGSGRTYGVGEVPASRAAHYGKQLVDETMLVADAATAAALFPPETGAFLYEPSLY